MQAAPLGRRSTVDQGSAVRRMAEETSKSDELSLLARKGETMTRVQRAADGMAGPSHGAALNTCRAGDAGRVADCRNGSQLKPKSSKEPGSAAAKRCRRRMARQRSNARYAIPPIATIRTSLSSGSRPRPTSGMIRLLPLLRPYGCVSPVSAEVYISSPAGCRFLRQRR